MASVLIDRQLDDTIAWLTRSLNNLAIAQGDPVSVSARQFLSHVKRLAERFSEHQYVINLCDNRYVFMVSLCASIYAQKTNLLPPNKNVATQQSLLDEYRDVLLVHDNSCEIVKTGPTLNLAELDWALSDTENDIPLIDEAHLAVISFTSGSTGQPKPNKKTWQTLVQSSAINAQYMLVDQNECHAHIATVPGQHMWGFETSVLLPMFSKSALVDARPFFPSDIVQLIRSIPMPSTLVSAPVHLNSLSKSLAASADQNTELRSILCATAPLDADLARQLEAQTGATLNEIYGCSEVGSMAVRRTAIDRLWQPFSGLTFAQSHNEEGDAVTVVTAAHLPEQITLEDSLVFDGQRFSLAGRSSDQIKIAGKRGSLAEVNAVLQRFDGLIDGVVIFPQQSRAVPRLVALVVLRADASKHQLRQHMAAFLDTAFVPRPILVVDALPREDNGKLGKNKILDLYHSCVKPA